VSGPQVTVWDPPVRLLHWLLAASYVTAYLTAEGGYQLHLLAGYAVLGVVAARIAWGFAGTANARFARFVRGPRTVVRYLRDMLRGTAPRHLGHNPAGGAMVLALLATLVVIASSGVALDAAENRSGPLAAWNLFLHTDRIEAVHETATNVSLALVACHLAGVAVMSVVHRENLVAAMIGGRKRAP